MSKWGESESWRKYLRRKDRSEEFNFSEKDLDSGSLTLTKYTTHPRGKISST